MNMQLTLDFLRDLRENNKREWFQENKSRYEEARKQMINLLNILIPAVRKIDEQVGALEPKECMFRIYRDIRFSKDKRPYKTNFGAVVGKGGRKSEYAGYYIHIEPGNSMLGGGIYHPSADVLKSVRREIYFNAPEFKKIINKDAFKANFGDIRGEKLKRPPKDFPKDFPDIDLLKFKDYIAMQGVSDDLLLSEHFTEHALNAFKVMKPLQHFINNAIDMTDN